MTITHDIYLKDGSVWKDTDPQESFLYRELQICQSCRDIMASPENLRALLATVNGMPGPGLPICAKPRDGERLCSARAIALRAVAAHNREEQERPRVVTTTGNMKPPTLIDISTATFKFNAWRNSSRKHAWHDITNLYLRCNNQPVPILDLEISVRADDPAAKYVTTRPVMLDMIQDTSKQIESWLGSCHKDHQNCMSPSPSRLPTRVVDVGQCDDPRIVRIHETCGAIGRYAALSYCWGGPQPVMLTKSTYQQLTKEVEVSTLPKTLEDAVRVTRDLKLRYLWIDALCIVQDELKDKENELGMMPDIYKNAYITIAAASANTCREGFLQTRDLRKTGYPRFMLPYRAWDDEAIVGTAIIGEAFHHDAAQEPINRRAWCLQERLLSPRIVMFGTNELIWQCQEGQDIAGGTGDSYLPGTERLHPAFFDQTKSISNEDFYDSWADVIADYTSRSLTFESDKLVAMSAIASEFQRLRDGDVYLAGLWRRGLIKWLSWVVDPSKLQPFGTQRLMPRPSTYIAPSWSWASVKGTVAMCSRWSEKEVYAEVIRCEITPLNAKFPTGQVLASSLQVRAVLKETRWSKQLLFREPSPNSEVLGKAFMDADEDIPEVIVCARLWKDSGLILVRRNDDSIYTRVGRFEIWTGVSVCDEWFAGCKVQTIMLL